MKFLTRLLKTNYDYRKILLDRSRRFNHGDPKQRRDTDKPGTLPVLRRISLPPLHRTKLFRFGIWTTLFGTAVTYFYFGDRKHEAYAEAAGAGGSKNPTPNQSQSHSQRHATFSIDPLEEGGNDHPKKSFRTHLYRLLPLRTISRTSGWFFSRSLPNWTSQRLLSWFVRTYNVNMEEAKESDLSKYKNLAELFGRELKEGVRPVNQMSPLVSPCDGRVLKFHRIPLGESNIEAATLPGEVKGVLYPVQSFFGIPNTPNGEQLGHDDEFLQQELLETFSSTVNLNSTSSRSSTHESRSRLRLQSHRPPSALYCCILYLGPGDYHRFHSPANWSVRFRRHFHGELMSVHPSFARSLPEVFSLNERVVYTGQWEYGFFSMCAVGATNVGSIKVYHDKELVTNIRKRRKQPYALPHGHVHGHVIGSQSPSAHDDAWFIGDSYEPYSDPISNEQKFRIRSRLPLRFRKGEPFGQFNLGSTIVLIFQAPTSFEQIFSKMVGKKIRVGETLL